MICLILFLGVSGIWILGFNTSYFTNPDAYDYAQMGREIHRGHGLSTLQIFPRHIPFLSRRDYLNTENWPNLYRYPLPTVLNAFFQGFVQDAIVASVLQSGTWFLLGIPVLFFLTNRLTNLTVAIISTIFYIADPYIFHSSYDGMTESLSTLLILSLILVAYSGELHKWKCIFLGILCGLNFLTRTQLFFLFPLAVLYVWTMAQKPKRYYAVTLVLAGMLLTVFPWCVHNLMVAGDPLFSFSTSRNLVLDAFPRHSDLEMQLHAPVEIFTIFEQYGAVILSKFLRNIIPSIISLRYWDKAFDQMYIPFLFFFLSFFNSEPLIHRQYNLFKWSSIVLILCNFFVLSLVFHHARFYTMFRPFVIVIGTYEMVHLFLESPSLRYLQRFRAAGFAILILVGLHLSLVGFHQQLLSVTKAHKNSPPVSQAELESYESLRLLTDKESVIASDISYKISLYADRRTIQLPSDPKELLEISKTYLPIEYVLLSKRAMTKSSSKTEKPSLFETYEGYGDFAASQDFLKDFEVVTQLSDGMVLFGKRSYK